MRRAHARTTMRISVHHLALLDHELIGPEERKYSMLKQSFAHYRAMFDQQTLPYLSYRLAAIIDELGRLMRLHADGGAQGADGELGLEDDDLMLLRTLYRDLTETLPALCELRLAVDALTNNIYEGWRDLQDIRKRQGFNSTKAQLAVRRVLGGGQQAGSSGSTGGKGRRARGADDDDQEVDSPILSADSESSGVGTGIAMGEQAWARLSASLASVPSLVRKVQAALLEQPPAATPSASVTLGKPKDNKDGAGDGDKDKDKGDIRSQRVRLAQAKARNERVLAVAEASVAELLRLKGLIPEYVIRLSDEGSLTPDIQCSPAEQTRRRTIEGLRFYVAIKINGKTVTHTSAAPLRHPALLADFKQHFELRLLHKPSSVSLDIFMISARSFLPVNGEKLIATVCVPFPGQVYGSGNVGSGGSSAGSVGSSSSSSASSHRHLTAAHGFTPTVGWLAFTSEDQTLADGGNALNQGRIAGMVLCSTEYEVSSLDPGHAGKSGQGRSQVVGVYGDDLSSLPPEAAPKEGEGLGTGWGMGSSRTGGGNPGRLLAELMAGGGGLDPLDPRNDHLIGRANSVVFNGSASSASLGGADSRAALAADRPVFSLSGDVVVPYQEGADSYINFAKFKEGSRMKLLKLREVKPFMFTEPIPLSETGPSETYCVLGLICVLYYKIILNF